jgi:hypothetical protein
VEKKPEKVECCEPFVRAWLEQTPMEAAKQVFEEWSRVHIPPRVWLQHALAIIQLQGKDNWIRASSILSWLEANQIEIEEDQPPKWLEEELFQPLCGLGYLDIGRYNGERAVRWKDPKGQAVIHAEEDLTNTLDKFYVQPNFELMIPPTVRLSVRWFVEDFAQLKQSDQMTIYAITKESLHQALEKRKSIREIIDFLLKHSLHELPENVKQNLLQWAEQYGRVRFVDAVLMRCADATLAQELENNPKFNQWIVEKITPQDFLVHKDHIKACIQFLDQHGYAPRKEIDTLDKSSANRSSGRAATSLPNKHRQGIIFSKNVFSNYSLDPTIPKLEDVVPSLKKLPISWTQDYRNYHTSTLRDLIQQAIDLKTKVRIGNGEEDWFVPVKLKQTDGSWAMEGRDIRSSDRTVYLEAINKIQILIP